MKFPKTFLSLLLYSQLLTRISSTPPPNESNFSILFNLTFKTDTSWTSLSIIDSTNPSILKDFEESVFSSPPPSLDFLVSTESSCLSDSFYSSLPLSSLSTLLFLSTSSDPSITLCSSKAIEAYHITSSKASIKKSINLAKSLIFQKFPSPASSSIILVSSQSRHLSSCEDYFSVLDNGICEPCINGCLKCSNSTSCDQCFPGSGSNFGYWLTSEKTCEFCKWYECSVCIDATRCQTCNSGHFKTDDEKCLPCTASCEICTSTKCTKCQNSYFLNGDVCEKCIVMCRICNDDHSCEACEERFFLDSSGTECLECGLKCLTCSDRSHCFTCQDGFVAVHGECVACVDNCFACQNRVCSKCYQKFYLDGSFNCLPCSDGLCEDCPSDVCKTCKLGSVLISGACMECPDGCKICDKDKVCKQCLIGPLINGGCLICGKHCVNCDDEKCYDCDPGFFEMTGYRDCFPCQSNCIDCNEEECKRCVDRYYIAGHECFQCSAHCLSCEKYEVCDKCDESYLLKAKLDESGNIFCQPCIANCSICLDETSCSVCKIGFAVNSDGLCESCGKGCSNCVDGFCKSCTDEFFFDPYQKVCYKCTDFCIKCSDSTSCQLCKIGYFWNTEASACYKCPTNCFDCIQGQCYECYIGFYLNTINSCAVCKEGCFNCKNYEKCLKCSDGYYLNSFTETCFLCMTYCDICFSASTCDKCSKGFYLKQNKCAKCPENCLDCDIDTTCYECGKGTYLDNGQCLNCDSKCSGCDSLDICTSCNRTYYLENTKCLNCYENCDICINPASCSKCKTGYSIENLANSLAGHDNSCIKCDDGCLDCESTVCFDCMSGYMMDNHKCIECPDNCIWCYSFYNPLTEITSYYCGWCLEGYLIDQPGCKSCGDYCLDCNNIGCLKCEDGYFIDEYETCTKCSPNCLDCFDLTFCFICDDLYNLNWGTGLCSNCPNHCLQCDIDEKCVLCEDYYYIDSNGLCPACGFHCIDCTKDDCITCDIGFYVDKNGDCDICKVGCTECESKDICKKCENGFYLEKFSETLAVCLPCSTGCMICEENSCKVCKDSYYLDLITESCISCTVKIPGCSWCSSPKKCDSCFVGFALDSDSFCRRCKDGCIDCFMESFNGQTAEVCKTCNSSYFLNEGRCKRCPENCLKCGDEETCFLCQKFYFIDSYFQCSACLPNCLSCRDKLSCDKCNTAFYWDLNSQKCTNCETGCESCTSNGCNSCKRGLYLNYTTNMCEFCTSNCNNCQSLKYCITCDPEYFFDEKSLKCLQCPSNCRECSSKTECYSCYTGYMNSGGLCSQCPKYCEICKTSGCVHCFEKYFLASNNICTECPNHCLHCETASKCTVCETGYFKTSSNSCEKCDQKCLSCTQEKCLICMDGFFKFNNSCSLCPKNCKYCVDGNMCELCYQGLFINPITGQCERCLDPGCEICSSESSCDLCKPGLLRNVDGICSTCPIFCVECDHGNKCIKCSKGYFPDSKSGMCFKCPVYCEDCNSFTNCKKCADNFITKADGTCIPCMRDCLSCETGNTCRQCEKGSFLNITSQCARCNKGCIHCSKLENCFECDNKLFLTDSVCRPCTDSKCLKCPGNKCKECLEGFFLDSNQICTKCFKDCALCSVFNECQACKSGYFLVENDSKCDKCRPLCLSCNSKNECFTCQSEFFLDPNTSPASCTRCPSKCEACLADLCLKCISGYYLGYTGLCWECSRGCEICQNDKICDKCKEGFYSNGLAVCQPCPSPCIKCKAEKICEACTSRFKLTPDRLCIACPEGCESCDDLNRCYSCSTSFILEGTSCFTCSNPEVLSIEISKDFLSLEVNFTSLLDKKPVICSKAITTNDTFGENWKCSIKEKTLKVIFGKDFLLDEYSNISIFTDQVFLRPCQVKKMFSLKASFMQTPPSPSGTLKGSTQASLLCENSKLDYYVDNVEGTFGFDPVLKWSSSYENPEFSIFLEKFKETRIFIPISKFNKIKTLLTVFVEISNCFKRKTVLKIDTNLMVNKEISVMIDAGTNIEILASKKFEINAKILETCGANSNFSYIWSLSNSTNPRAKMSDFDLEVNEKVLKVPKNTLRPFFKYLFTVKVTSGKLFGNSSVWVDAKADDLVVIFNRKDGLVPISFDVLIDASDSNDPNKLSEKLSFHWSCTHPNTHKCRTKQNNFLESPEKNESIFLIPKDTLNNAKTYIISLTISTSTDNRQTTSSLALTTEEKISTDIKIFMDRKRVESSKSCEIKAKVTSSTQFHLLWSQVQGPSVSILEVSLNNLFIPANTLKPGKTYEFQLTAYEYFSLLSPSSVISFKTNQIPECLGDLSINKWSGMVQVDEFSLSIQPCIDQDEDYPLTYEFYMKKQSGNLQALEKARFSNSLSFILLEDDIYLAYVKVIDQLGGSNRIALPKSFFVKSNSRFLETQDPEQLFMKIMQKYEDLRSFYAISILKTFPMTSSQVKVIFQNCLEFYKSSEVELSEVKMMISIVLTIFEYQKSTLNYDLVKEYLNVLVEFGRNCTEEFNQDVIKSVWMVATEVVKNGKFQEKYDLLAGNFSDYFARIYSKEKHPGTVLINVTDSNMTFFKKREICKNFEEKSFKLPRNVTVFIESLPFNSSDLIDINLKSFPSPESFSDFVEITFTRSGSYENNELQVEDEQVKKLTNSTVLFEVPILKNSLNMWTCEVYEEESWKEDACELESISNDLIKFRISHTSLFRVSIKEDPRSFISSYPITLVMIFISFFIFLLIGMVMNCRESEKVQIFDENLSDLARRRPCSDNPSQIYPVNVPPGNTLNEETVLNPRLNERCFCLKSFWNKSELSKGDIIIGNVFVLISMLWLQLSLIKIFDLKRFKREVSLTIFALSLVFAFLLHMLVLVISKFAGNIEKKYKNKCFRRLLLVVVFCFLAGIAGWSASKSVYFTFEESVVAFEFFCAALTQVIISVVICLKMRDFLKLEYRHRNNIDELQTFR